MSTPTPRHPFDLSGKVALVTGSTIGIGEATARVLAQAGAHVVISSRKQEDCDRVAAEFRAQGLSAEARACHIGRMEDIAAMGEHLHATHGGLDILVNNAVLSPLRSIDDTELGLFTKTVEVNLRGYWYLSLEATKRMKPRGGGSIVNIASIAALHPDRNLGLYSTLKTALIGMSRSFALEYGAFGIRVNTVMPGLIKTKLANAYDPEQQARTIARTPVGRLGEGEDIGNAVLYLSSPGASFVSGASLVVDGGLTVASQ
ncbi:glucose 1-dehydrogenase [Hydrogenophaga sp.]|uniref:glucose 1-dehydrogenase n=1 Tax=Hydrogenophaga sp. TaxID=1904254 RepID=UPI0035AE0590